MKFGYKVLIVLAVFAGAMFFFSGGIRKTVFSTSAQVTPMGDASLPTVSMEVDSREINVLHGYVSNLDEMIMRETITPLTSDRTFTVVIDEHESNVKKLKYEVYNDEGRELEADSFTVLEVEGGGPKRVKIVLKETLRSGSEYVLKLALITNESKRIYYYTRLKMYDDGHIAEKLAFAQNFHDILLNGTAVEKETLKMYLESSRASDNTTFAHVNIKSSFNLVTWGELEPILIWEQVPTITEFYDSMASIQIKSLVSVETDNGTERYLVKENFRFNYTSNRVYLYNYDRTMESIFDVANTSLTKNEFKLGITNDTDAQTEASDSGKYVAFVYDRELMLYNVETNELVEVFSFYQGVLDYEREYHDSHAVKLLNVHDNGDVDFCVYGYMNRGEYEGRVGIVLYRYYEKDRRIAEQLYIPINSSFQILKNDMTDLMYLSKKDIFYFALYDAIYSYNIVTGSMTMLADNVPEESILYIEGQHFVCWQEAPGVLESKAILVLDMESGQTRRIEAPYGETVRLYGRINDNMVYGYAREEDVHINPDGSKDLPAYRLVIENRDGEVLKEYTQEGYYIESIELGENILVLNRVVKKLGSQNDYAAADNDTIINRLMEEKRQVAITRRITDRILTEYYISLPSGVNIYETPTQSRALSSIINYDTTSRITVPENRAMQYYAYSFGEVVYASSSSAVVIAAADQAIGSVINQEGKLIWERGVKSARYEIGGFSGVAAGGAEDSVRAAMATIMKHKDIEEDCRDFNRIASDAYSYMRAHMKKGSPVNLTGASLDEVLYYVYKGRPVIAIRGDGSGCVIYGYDALTVLYYDPVRDKSIRVATKDFETNLATMGNIFISYVN